MLVLIRAPQGRLRTAGLLALALAAAAPASAQVASQIVPRSFAPPQGGLGGPAPAIVPAPAPKAIPAPHAARPARRGLRQRAGTFPR